MPGRRSIAAIAALLVALIAGGSQAQSRPGPRELLERMSLREKVGQLVMVSLGDRQLMPWEREVIRRQDLGGVILFSKNYSDRSQLRALTREIQAAVRGANRHEVGALISVDQEGGVVTRFPDRPPRYSALEIGASGDVSLAYRQGRATGRELREEGVNVDLAPVADLDLPPEHVMRTRSFGRGPRTVGRFVSAFARGLQAQKTAATLKHFPGLGGATVNSDDGRAFVYRSKRKLRTIDAVPFRRGIEGGAKLVMLSHAMYLKDGGKRPASLNRHIATERLRDGLGFRGVAISDALEPVSWYFGGDVARTCRATVWAGVDIALITGNATVARSCAAEIRTAVRNGKIPYGRINEATLRVLRLKLWLGLL